MRITVGILIFLFSCSFSGKQLKKSKDIIYWSKDVKLTWNDFKGNVKNLPSNIVAISNIKIGYAPIFKGPLDVRVSFNKSKSIKNKRLIDDALLKHEQYHFNIAELFARRFRKRLKKEGTGIKEDLSSELFSQMQIEYKVFQELYDKETELSTNVSQQEEWEEKIDKELADLEEFASK
jgi:hypothetical protein